jgi:biopolymer transport protein ExbD
MGAWLVRVRPDDLDLNAEPMEAQMLAQRVASRVAADPEQRILVQPAGEVTLQRLIDVLDLLRDAGASRLTLASP